MNEKIVSIIDVIVREKVRFNKVLGVTLDSLEGGCVRVKFPMRDELVGNFVHDSLHGGVISATLDLAGGIMAFIGAMRDVDEQSWQAKMEEKFGKLGTIDLRIDYLRPGIGKEFFAAASILRVGNKVAVTRMELHNEQHHLIAVGTGTYLVG